MPGIASAARAPAWCAAALFLVAAVLASAPGDGNAAVKSVAVVDFSARGRFEPTGESAWLGSAISELLQAKLQLLGGVRVLERLRIRALVRETEAGKTEVGDARIGESAASTDLAALAGVVPAEVLIAGSVSVDPKDARRIRVQARAFETGTSKIVSEAAFSGTGELAGLLKIAEDLAKTLADGLGLSYSPEQLAYAEPVNLDALRLLVDGEAHLAAGRDRDAIATLQKALDGNEGRYFAAAHRLQGEAYQALAKASAGEQERAVREEYLGKFKEDALAASGALYDLGLAYEANGMWREAAAAYTDYLRAVGSEGETVRWVYTPPGVDPKREYRLGETRTDLGPPVLEDGARVHTIAHRYRVVPDKVGFAAKDERWVLVTLDAADGRVLRELPLELVLGEPGVPDVERWPSLAGAEAGRVYVLWGHRLEVGQIARRIVGLPTLAAVAADGAVLWRRELGPLTASVPGGAHSAHRGKLYFHLVDEGQQRPEHSVLALDGVSGRTLGEVRLSERDVAFLQQKPLRGLDLDAGTLTVADGVHDLSTGALAPHGDLVPASRAVGPVPPSRRVRMPTGYPGVTWRRDWPDAKLFRGGEKIMDLPGCEIDLEVPPRPVRGSLVCRREDGFLLVDPGRLATIAVKAAPGTPLRLDANDGTTVALAYEFYPDRSAMDPQFGLPGEGRATILNFFDAAAGRLLAKHRADDRPQLLGRDFLVRRSAQLLRIGIMPHATAPVVPAPEAHLRIASCSLELGETVAVEEPLARFEAANVGDPRGEFLRMRLAGLAGKAVEAGRLALQIIKAGGLDAETLRACTEHLKRALPEVRESLQAPLGGTILFQSSLPSGKLVGTGSERGGGYRHLVLDIKDGSFQTAPAFAPGAAPGERWEIQRYASGRIYGAVVDEETERARPAMLDLLSGERVVGPLLAGPPGRFLATMPGVQVAGKERDASLYVRDPDNLDLLGRVPVASPTEAFFSADVVVFGELGTFVTEGMARLTVVDRVRREKIAEVELPLKSEILFGVAADRTTLYTAVGGADYEAYLYGGRANWLRLEAHPLSTGGATWSYTAEGVIAGGPVLEGGSVVLPCHEGRLPPPSFVDAGTSELFSLILEKPLALKKVRHDRGTGVRTGEEPLQPEPWDHPVPGPVVALLMNEAKGLVSFEDNRSLFAPEPPRRLFPGRRETLNDSLRGYREYWVPKEGSKPLEVQVDPAGADFLILRQGNDPPTIAVGSGVVLESVGGGVILVKDGAVAESLVPVAGRLQKRTGMRW